VSEVRTERENGAPAVVSPAAGPVNEAAELERALDRVSLTQALIDAEMATARVIDLTERLVDARSQISVLRSELERLRIEHHQYVARQRDMENSQAFRLASRIWSIRNALRR
jgi:hypothetical protein